MASNIMPVILLTQDLEWSIRFCKNCGRPRPCRFHWKNFYYCEKHSVEMLSRNIATVRQIKQKTPSLKPSKPSRIEVIVKSCLVCGMSFTPPKYRENRKTCGKSECLLIYRGSQVSLSFNTRNRGGGISQ